VLEDRRLPALLQLIERARQLQSVPNPPVDACQPAAFVQRRQELAEVRGGALAHG
jgi:hypothetical protein